MTLQSWLLLAVYLLVLLGAAKPLGLYMAKLMEAPRWQPLARLEDAVFRVCGVDPAREMGWIEYALAMLVFNLVGLLVVYALQRLQAWLPLNPQEHGAVTPDSSLQHRRELRHQHQLAGLRRRDHDELSHADARRSPCRTSSRPRPAWRCWSRLIRGFARALGRRRSATSGSICTRRRSTSCCRCRFVLALVLVEPGRGADLRRRTRTSPRSSPITYDAPKLDAAGQPLKDEKGKPSPRRRPHRADAAARPGRLADRDQAARHQRRRLLQRQLGASVREPDAALELPRDAGDPADPGRALLHVRQDGRRHAPGLGGAGRDDGDLRRLLGRRVWRASSRATRCSPRSASTRRRAPCNPGGNMEGKEARFGIANSALWATATTAASNGSVNSMHDSFTPLGGLVPMWLMQLGEVVFGGVGSGLYGMMVFAIVAVFIAGLMIGRTPEYLGKKIEAFEIKMASIAILMPPFARAGRHRDRGAASTRAGRASPIPARTASPRSCTRSRRPATTTAAHSPGCPRNTPFYNTVLGAGDVVRALLA